MEMQAFKCKTCGESLGELVAMSQNGLVTCPSCQNVWTIPKKETGEGVLQFLRIGEHELDVGKFDEAYTAYQKAAELDAGEPEAYFGMALAEFKVRYLKDHVNNRLQPICGGLGTKKFVESDAYLSALARSTNAQFAEYEKRAAEIDYILGEFSKLQQAGKRYDCFICVKVSENARNRTEDSRNADYIYRLLQDKGYKPFYSERELHNVTGADYEARILYALHTSECMLVVCSNPEYLQTPWVKNEYTRFLKLVNDEQKESDSITIIFDGTPVERLPGRAGKIQGINYALRGSDDKIVEFVNAHTPESKKRRAEERRRQQEKEEAILKKLDQLQKMQNGRGMQATAASLLTRGYQELADGNGDAAEKFFNRVLEAEPENGEAWWGKLLIELGVWNDDLLNERLEQTAFEEMNRSRNFTNALKYADGEFRAHLDEVLKRLRAVAADRQAALDAEKAAISVDPKFVGVPEKVIKRSRAPKGARILGWVAAIAMIALVIVFSRIGRLDSAPVAFTFLLRIMRKIPLKGVPRKLVGLIFMLVQAVVVGIAVRLVFRVILAMPAATSAKNKSDYNKKVALNTENAAKVKDLEERIRIYNKFCKW